MPPTPSAAEPAAPQGPGVPDWSGRPVTIARLREWVRDARPNARLPYGRGWHLKQACSAELAAFVRALADLGLVTPHQVRAEKGLPPIYIVQRTKRAVRPGADL